MTITRRDLEMLSDDEVRELRSTVTAILDCRRPEPRITVNGYEFHHNYAPARQPKPYVAKLKVTSDGKIERDRFDISKTGKGVHRNHFARLVRGG